MALGRIRLRTWEMIGRVFVFSFSLPMLGVRGLASAPRRSQGGLLGYLCPGIPQRYRAIENEMS